MIEIKTKILSVLNPNTGEYESIDTLKGDKGDMPTKGTDYWTPADQEQIVQQTADKIAAEDTFIKTQQGVEHAGKVLIVDANGKLALADMPAGSSGDIVGVVGEDNSIVLTGVLPEGMYTIKYEMEDGSYQDVGELTLSSEYDVPLTLTLGKIDYNNNGAIVASDTYLYSDAIVRERNKEYTASLIGTGAQHSIRVVYYDANGNYLGLSEKINGFSYAVETGAWSIPLIAEAEQFRLRIYHSEPSFVSATIQNIRLTKRTLKYTDWMALATDESGAVFGYKQDYRFGSYCGIMSNDTPTAGYFATGFIPYTIEQVKSRVPFYMKGITLDLTSLPTYVRFGMMIPGSTDWFGVSDTTDMTSISQFTITQLGTNYYMFRPNSNVYTSNGWNNKAITHARWSLPGTGAGVIITVDEPIE